MNSQFHSRHPSLNIPSPNHTINSTDKESKNNSRKPTVLKMNFKRRQITKRESNSYFKLIRSHTKDPTFLSSPSNKKLTLLNLELSSLLCEKPELPTETLTPSPDLLKDFIKVRECNSYELIEQHPLAHVPIVSAFLHIQAYFSELSTLICKNWVFETFITLVIVANTLTLALDDAYSISQEADYVFLIIYTVEACLKIVADGFVVPKKSYLRDKWNVLDFLIVVTGWVQNVSVKLNSLRTLRILRPLRNISSIKGMRVIFIALIKASIPLLRILGVLFVFILVFSIAGLETMSGKFRNRCMELDTGLYAEDSDRCGSELCTLGKECVLSLSNPNYGISSFDNIFYAIVMVFEVVTLQTWVSLMELATKTISSWTQLFYIPLAFLGAFLILNLTLAVIKSAFTNSMKKVKKKTQQSFLEDEEIIDYQFEDEFDQRFDERFDERSRKRHDTRTKLYTLKFDEKISARHKTLMRQPSSVDLLEISPFYSSDELSLNFNRRKKNRTVIIKLKNKPKISKSHMIIPYPDTSFEPPNFQNQINFKKWTEELNTNTLSMANSLRKRKHVEAHSKFEQFEEPPTSHHLKNLQNCIKIRKNLIKKLKTGLSTTKIKILLSESSPILSTSSLDVSPELKGFYALDYSRSDSYTFTYKGVCCEQEDELEVKWREDSEYIKIRYPEYYSDLSRFSYLELKQGPYGAFNTLKGQALERVKGVELADELKGRIEGHWSGLDVDFDAKRQGFYSELMAMMQFRVWSASPWDKVEKMQFLLGKVEQSQFFWVFMMFCVIINALLLSLEYYGISDSLQEFLNKSSIAFTVIFSFELIIKLCALGINRFSRDTMNLIDTIVIILSWLDVITNVGSSALTAFRVIRIFRVLRVARIIKIFRYLGFMKSLIQVITSSFSKYLYLALLLILLNTIFALLGTQIFAHNSEAELPRSNFSSFGWSFLSVFQVLTLSSYSEVLYDNMNSDAGPWSALYVIVWIIVGNFILLNLAIAILLDSFMEQSMELEKTTNLRDENTMKRSKSLFNENSEKLARNKEKEKLRILEVMRTKELEKIEDLREMTTFEDIECEFSFFFFSKYSKIRFFTYRVVASKAFEGLTIFVIFANCFVIIWETYTLKLNDNDVQVILCNCFQIIFGFFYLAEFFIKAICFGFYEGQNSYMKNGWNLLDFFLMLCTVTDSLLYLLATNTGHVLKILRAFRPLRFISKIKSMKSLVSAVLSSFSAIFNVVIVLFVIWLMFAVLGVSIFAGKLYSCDNPNIDNQQECLDYGFKWVNAHANFDNVFEAFLTLFIVCLLELWNEIMYDCIDARDVGLSMKRDYNISAAYFFLFFIFIVSFYFLKLFMGVLFFKFYAAKKGEISIHNLFLSEKEIFWVEMQKFILKSTAQSDIVKEPENALRRTCYQIVNNTFFNLFIATCILLNIIELSMQYYGASELYLSTLDTINILFVALFSIEVSLKLTAFGVKTYFSSAWNTFDFLVVICGYIDIIITSGSMLRNRFLRTGPQIVRTFRILRLSRLLRVFKPLKLLNDLIRIVYHSISPLLNVVGLLILFIFIFSVIGVYLFNEVNSGRVINEANNFHNFSSAFFSLLYCITLCEWPLYLYDCSDKAGKPQAGIFFFVYMSVMVFVVTNLFIMVIVQNYEDFESDPNSCLHIFAKAEKRFKKVWERFSGDYNGLRIFYKSLPEFMYELGSGLGFGDSVSYEQGIKTLAKMDFCIENDGSVFYKELLFAVLKRKHGINRGKDKIAKLILKNEENKTVKRLNCMVSLTDWRFTQRKDLEVKQMRKQTKKMLTELVFVRKVFGAWRRVVEDGELGRLCQSEEDED